LYIFDIRKHHYAEQNYTLGSGIVDMWFRMFMVKEK